MRILFLTETIPAPLDSGGRIKTFHTLGMLATRHEISCQTFIRTPGQRAHAALLEDRCESVALHLVPRSPLREAISAVRALGTGRPFTLVRHNHRAAHAAIRALARREPFDLVYCDHLSMVQYGRGLGLPLLYDAHNVEWELVARHATTLARPARAAARLEAARLRLEEARACREASLVLTLTEANERALRLLAPSSRIRTLPIALDVRGTPRTLKPASTPHVLFVGGLHWPPNAQGLEWFVTHIWPIVRHSVPDARMFCVGRASAAQRARLEKATNVSVVGAVDNVEPWFRDARVLAVPLQSGSGMRVKILDAFARRLPVVATPVGWEGIDAVAGRHLLSADGPEAFARELVRVLRDPDLAEALAEAGHRLALDRYDLASVIRQLLAAVEGAASPGARSPAGRLKTAG